MANDTKGQVEGILSELGKKIDHLIDETKDAREDVREDFEKKINELKKKKAKVEKEFYEYKDKHGDKWTDAKVHLTSALSELKKAVEAVFKENKTKKE